MVPASRPEYEHGRHQQLRSRYSVHRKQPDASRVRRKALFPPRGVGGVPTYGELTGINFAVVGGIRRRPRRSPRARSRRELIFAVQTNTGNLAKALVTASSSSSISFQYDTFGASSTGSGGGTPTITAVLNNSSRIPPGFQNSGVAPSSLVALMGSNLSTGTDPNLQDSTKPGGIPTTVNGATLSIAAGGKTFTPGIWSASATQINFVLPAAVPVGSATVTVTFSGATSAPFTFQVVAVAVGIDAYILTPNAPYTLLEPRPPPTPSPAPW